MAFETFSLAESMAGAAAMGETRMALREYGEKKKKEDAIKAARTEAVDGTPDSIKTLMKLDPEEGANLIDALSRMDERQRKNVKFGAERTAKQMLWVEQGANDEEKASRWDQVVDHMVNNLGQKDAAKWKGKYSPAQSQRFIMKAMTVDHINEQFAFGQVKVGMEGGKPVYFMTNKAGQVRVAEKVKPTEKMVEGAPTKADKFKFKASDANSIRAAAAGLYGGTWSPETGRVMGVDKESTAKVLSISERAAKLYREAEGSISHDEAAAQAARELGIQIQKLAPRSIKDFLAEQPR